MRERDGCSVYVLRDEGNVILRLLFVHSSNVAEPPVSTSAGVSGQHAQQGSRLLSLHCCHCDSRCCHSAADMRATLLCALCAQEISAELLEEMTKGSSRASQRSV